jgi:hypothetical protein
LFVDWTNRSKEGSEPFGGFAATFEGDISAAARIEKHPDLARRLIDEDKFGDDRSRCDFFFLGVFRFALLVGAIFRDAPREAVFGNGQARARDLAFAVRGGTVNEAAEAGHFGVHRPTFGGEVDRQAVAGDDEFEHRRGRARAAGHQQRREHQQRRDGYNRQTHLHDRTPRSL